MKPVLVTGFLLVHGLSLPNLPGEGGKYVPTPGGDSALASVLAGVLIA